MNTNASSSFSSRDHRCISNHLTFPDASFYHFSDDEIKQSHASCLLINDLKGINNSTLSIMSLLRSHPGGTERGMNLQ